jgi:hypothetical protein
MAESNPIPASSDSERLVNDEDSYPATSDRVRRSPPANRTLGIVALLLTMYSWFLTIALALGQWLLGGAWPGDVKEYVSIGVTLGLTLIVGTVGRPHFRALRRQTRGRSISVNGPQALAVTILTVVAGAYGTWLFCGP